MAGLLGISRRSNFSHALDVDSYAAKRNSMTDKPKQGRPPKPADQQTKPYSVRLTDAEIAKLKAIGSERLRAWIRRTPTKER